MKSEKEIYSKARTDARKIPSVFCIFAISLFAAFMCGCSDFMSPVESTPTPNEYEFNYWLLNSTYLFEEELPNLDPKGDSVQKLYATLEDPYTRYVAPSKSEAATQQMNTSIVEGDIGLEYMYNLNAEHPMFVYRVYPESPAALAKVPRHGNIISINGREIKSYEEKAVYDSIMNYSKEITLRIAFESDTSDYSMEKTTIYAPTIFVDTLDGMIYIQIREFKLNTFDKKNGTYGELKSYLDSTRNEKGVRILDLRNNPGGHVNQCVSMADLFVKEGTLSTRHWRTFNSEGKPTHYKISTNAKPGDAGENGKFLLLVNGNSASCAEIFTAAVTELAPIPVVGQTSYGKGIGQTSWSTKAGGLAIITNLEFLTPKGNSYHKKGIVPDYPCEITGSVYDCVADAAEKEFGTKKSSKKAGLYKFDNVFHAPTFGGAYIESEN